MATKVEHAEHIEDYGGEGGGTVIKESPEKPHAGWLDYSLLQMSPAPEVPKVSHPKGSSKKKK